MLGILVVVVAFTLALVVAGVVVALAVHNRKQTRPTQPTQPGWTAPGTYGQNPNANPYGQTPNATPYGQNPNPYGQQPPYQGQ